MIVSIIRAIRLWITFGLFSVLCDIISTRLNPRGLLLPKLMNGEIKV